MTQARIAELFIRIQQKKELAWKAHIAKKKDEEIAHAADLRAEARAPSRR